MAIDEAHGFRTHRNGSFPERTNTGQAVRICGTLNFLVALVGGTSGNLRGGHMNTPSLLGRVIRRSLLLLALTAWAVAVRIPTGSIRESSFAQENLEKLSAT